LFESNIKPSRNVVAYKIHIWTTPGDFHVVSSYMPGHILHWQTYTLEVSNHTLPYTLYYPHTPGTIPIKHLREKLKLRENFGTELQQNQRILENLKIRVGCRINFVQVYINCLQIIQKNTLRQLKEISFFLAFNLWCFMNMGLGTVLSLVEQQVLVMIRLQHVFHTVNLDSL